MKIDKLYIASAILAISIASTAQAEDDYRYYNNGNQKSVGQSDNSYQLPPAYNGQYYPQEQEPVATYYNNERQSQNNVSNDIRDNASGYYNYYY